MDGKENGRTPAAAFVEFDTSDGHDNGRYPIWAQHAGLTKRELFAAMAMQGYCSVQEGWDQPAREVAKCAALMADALLAALNAEESK
jgi:hypothetical protein